MGILTQKGNLSKKFIENTIILIGVVHTIVYNVEVIFSGSKIYFQIRKLIYFYSKNRQKIRNKIEIIAKMSHIAFRVYWIFTKKEILSDITKK